MTDTQAIGQEAKAVVDGLSSMIDPTLVDDPQRQEKIIDLYTKTLVVINDGQVMALDRESTRGTYASTLPRLIADGWTSSKKLHEDIHVVSSELVYYTKRFGRYRDDGSLVEQVCASYTLVKDEGEWRIAVITRIDPSVKMAGEE